jgi:hypothetical protein
MPREIIEVNFDTGRNSNPFNWLDFLFGICVGLMISVPIITYIFK